MGNVTRPMNLQDDKVSEYREVIRNYDRPFYDSEPFKVIDSTVVTVDFDLNNMIKSVIKSGKEMDSLSVNNIVRKVDTRRSKYLSIFKMTQ
jgi:hypothetical protein